MRIGYPHVLVEASPAYLHNGHGNNLFIDDIKIQEAESTFQQEPAPGFYILRTGEGLIK